MDLGGGSTWSDGGVSFRIDDGKWTPIDNAESDKPCAHHCKNSWTSEYTLLATSVAGSSISAKLEAAVFLAVNFPARFGTMARRRRSIPPRTAHTLVLRPRLQRGAEERLKMPRLTRRCGRVAERWQSINDSLTESSAAL
jgi:hypothetical protein